MPLSVGSLAESWDESFSLRYCECSSLQNLTIAITSCGETESRYTSCPPKVARNTRKADFHIPKSPKMRSTDESIVDTTYVFGILCVHQIRRRVCFQIDQFYVSVFGDGENAVSRCWRKGKNIKRMSVSLGRTLWNPRKTASVGTECPIEHMIRSEFSAPRCPVDCFDISMRGNYSNYS